MNTTNEPLQSPLTPDTQDHIVYTLHTLNDTEKMSLNRWMMLSGWTSRISLIEPHRGCHSFE